ncbi:MAG: hypothetical protein ACLT3Y_01155 [Ruminococcus callidus]
MIEDAQKGAGMEATYDDYSLSWPTWIKGAGYFRYLLSDAALHRLAQV